MRLRESEARYRLLAERSPDIIIQYDIEGRIEYLSPAAHHYGVDPETMIGRNVAELVAAGDQERNDRFMADLAAGRPLPQGDQNRWRTPIGGGRFIDFEGLTTPIEVDGRVVGAMSVLRDITSRVALEEELRRKKAEAEAAVLAKAEFLANMSHEIRTPLTAVIGFASLVARLPGLPEKARTYVDRIARSGEALNAIVNNVLDFSRVEAGQVDLKPELFEAGALAAETLALVEADAAAKGLSLRVEAEGELPAHLLADAGRLRQVLLNLVTNAVKFTRRGGVTVAIAYDAAAQRLRFAVADTGIGIPRELSDRLFQRFSQIDGSNARRFGGVGLGLAISKGLVELMGGEIGVESVVGAGSTFWIEVPAPEVRDEAPAAVAATDVPDRPLRVLVVDDAPVNRELIIALVSPFRFEITDASDGEEAVAAAHRSRFDVILMDVQMPGMDGLAATREIRQSCELNHGTPILAVSASVLPSDVEACRRAGMDDHIPKPIGAAELIGKIARWTAADERQAQAV